MKERPILFSAPMVRALLDGSKTQTRRAAKLPPVPDHLGQWGATSVGGGGVYDSQGRKVPHQGAIWHTRTGKVICCPYGQPGDRLWVRETHFINDYRGASVPADERHLCEILYRATDEKYVRNCEDSEGLRWTPSIHMPRWASRILLEVTSVRIERLQAISEVDAIAEGIERRESADGEWAHYADTGLSTDAIGSYRSLWELISGPSSWGANPWVWVVEFRRTVK